jgi:hypothetical protein
MPALWNHCWRSFDARVRRRGIVAERRRSAVMQRAARRVVLLLLFCAVLAVARAQNVSDSVGRVSFKVLPETVTVGQPFVVSLRAIPPRGRQALAPAVPDTGGLVEPLDPAIVTRRGDTLSVRYRLLAWQPGVLAIPFGPVLMRRDSSDLSVPVDIRVVVASVLPADSSDRIPKDPRALFPFVTHWWDRWWQWALALLGVAAALYALWRWRTRERKAAPVVASAVERADAAFARLDRRELTAAGEGARHVALVAEIVRQYLADIEPALALSLTNAEVLIAVEPIAGMPDKQLAQLLREADAIRFAGRRVDHGDVRRVSGLARELVRDIDRVRSAMLVQAA